MISKKNLKLILNNVVYFKPDINGKHKYIAYLKNGDKVKFGSKNYKQFYDKLGFYSDKDHLDLKRRNNYKARHSAILALNSKGKKVPAYQIPLSSSYFSWHLLW